MGVFIAAGKQHLLTPAPGGKHEGLKVYLAACGHIEHYAFGTVKAGV